MTVADVLAAVTARLAAAGVPTPAVDAELLLRHVTGWSRTRVLLSEGDVAEDAIAALESLVRRREAREPLQLIVGSVGFRYLDLLVRPGVFIPRPETEVLAGEAIRRVPDDGVVVEPCTGSGAVACAVALESRAATVIATDHSAEAVRLARQNVERSGVAVTVLHGDLLEPVPAELAGQVDVLVSNPPYLASDELAEREPEVAEWDPRDALVSGATGYEVTDRLTALAGQWLRPGGWLLLEVDSVRADETAARARAAGLGDAEVLLDLTGAQRVVVARRR